MCGADSVTAVGHTAAMRIAVAALTSCLILVGCGQTTELSAIPTTEAGLAALAEGGFTCTDPEITDVAKSDEIPTDYTIIDCEDFALDLFADMPAWEKQFASDCTELSSPDQRVVLGEVDLVFGSDWLVRSRKYGDTIQWLPDAGPKDFASKLGGRVETWADTCVRLGAWD
jgi:hypothetical protein